MVGRAGGDISRQIEPEPIDLGGIACERGRQDQFDDPGSYEGGPRGEGAREDSGGVGPRFGQDALEGSEPILVGLAQEAIGFVDDEEAEVVEGEAGGALEMGDEASGSGDENVGRGRELS